MTVALVVVALVAIAVIAGTMVFATWAARRASEETRQQMHAALVDERALWISQAQSWAEERKMLLERLSDREGRQFAAIMPTPTTTDKSAQSRPVGWDADLEPFDFEAAIQQEDQGVAG